MMSILHGMKIRSAGGLLYGSVKGVEGMIEKGTDTLPRILSRAESLRLLLSGPKDFMSPVAFAEGGGPYEVDQMPVSYVKVVDTK